MSMDNNGTQFLNGYCIFLYTKWQRFICTEGRHNGIVYESRENSHAPYQSSPLCISVFMMRVIIF